MEASCAQLARLAVGVGAALLAEANHHVHETTIVLEALLGTTSWILLGFLLGNLGGLSAHLTSTSQRSVHLSHGG